MELLLQFMMDLVALGLAGVAVLAACRVASGDVHIARNPLARVVLTILLAVVGLWILSIGIRHLGS